MTHRRVRPPKQPSAHAVHLHRSSLRFTLWWLGLLLLHSFNAAYYVGAAVLYRAIRWTNVDFQLKIYSIGISPTHYYTISTIHWLLGAAHGVCIAAMVIGSVCAKRLVFWPRMPTALSARLESWNSKPDGEAHRLHVVQRFVLALVRFVFGRQGLLGVDSVYFDHLHLSRELVETTLQTIQVYRMSYLLPRVWLIRFYVVLLVANCWSTPLVHRYYAHRHFMRRLMSLLCDAVLDMVSSVGVSLWIFATYAPQFADPVHGFPLEQWFQDVWFANMQQEFKMMLVASWADLASRLVFALALLQCMESIKEMLTPKEPTSPKVSLIALKIQPTAIVPSRSTPPTLDVVKAPDRPRFHRFVTFVLEKAGPAFFVGLGFAILVVHLVSETRGSSVDVPCQLAVHPWFVTKPACSLIELDCHQLGISGSQASMEKAWNTFECGATARIVVRHCPQLEIPPTIQHFHQLSAIKLYNCSITSWSEDAALTTTTHPNVRVLFFIRTDFPNGELFPGLRTSQFPQALKCVITSVTNLRTLPDNLHELWPPSMTLGFELSQFHEVPTTIVHMNALFLSFAGSPISAIPPDIFESPLLECVLLSNTLIQELPRVVHNVSPALFLLFIENTNVSTFWSWMDPLVNLSLWLNTGLFNAHGTPFCTQRDEIAAGNRSRFGITTTEPNATDLAAVMDVSTPEKLAFAVAAVACEDKYPFYFPLDLQDAGAL